MQRLHFFGGERSFVNIYYDFNTQELSISEGGLIEQMTPQLSTNLD